MTAINKFNKSLLYTIRSPHTDKYYIGSTTQILCKRFSDHNVNYKRHLNGTCPNITSSYKILELGGAYIEMLEEINCENRNQLEKREGELIREHKANCVNHCIPGRTKKEWSTDNADRLREQHKQYALLNADTIKAYQKEYNLLNADKLKQVSKEYRLLNVNKAKEYSKEYRETNSNKLKEQKKEYVFKNSDKLKEQMKEYRFKNSEKIKEHKRKRYAEKKLLKDLESITI